TAAELNNTVEGNNTRTATIRSGRAGPTSLAGGRTLTSPVKVTYNDSGTEVVEECVFTRAVKSELGTAKNHLGVAVN
ncbi:hypothetical protein, partial [Staphylococcus aureus]